MKSKLSTRRVRTLEMLEPRHMLAATPRLLGDVNAQPAGSVEPNGGSSSYVQVGDHIFFSAYDSAFGEELWKTDGTTDGTIRVKDISPGPAGTSLQQLTEHDGLLFFNAIEGASGSVTFSPLHGSLWVSDGTAEGTRVVDSPVADSMVSTATSGLVFANNRGLWRYQNGSKTLLLSSGDVYGVSLIEGRVYFKTAFNTGAGLWTTDGTVDGTVRLTDFDTSALAASDGLLYYSTSDGPLWRVWQTDGTLAGTPDDPLFEFSLNPSQVEIQDKTFYFSTHDSFVGPARYWSFDTSDPVLREISDQEGQRILGRVDFPARPEWDFYFSGLDESGELWRTDGTGEGTVRLSEFAESATAFGDHLLFADSDQQLWRTDGTIEGTIPLKEITVGDKFPKLQRTDNAVYFHGRGDDAAGMELWKTDGTIEGTVLVKDIHAGTADFDVKSFQTLGDQIVLGGAFAAVGYRESDTVDSLGTWAFDTLGNQLTQLNSEVQFGSESVQIGDQVFFVGEHPSQSTTLWKTDGTSDGTHRVSSLDRILRVGSLNGELIVNSGGRLYKLSDLDEPAVQLAPSRTFGHFFLDFLPVNNILVFSATDQADVPGLWRTDGTDSGTYSIITGEAHDLTALGNQVLFRTYESDRSLLWASDGTVDGTHVVNEFRFGFLNGFTQLGDFLYFRVQRTGSSNGLWRTDGTTEGTERVVDVRVSTDREGNVPMTPYGDLLLFTAEGGDEGSELWRTDGTAEGTWLIKDIRAGARGSDISEFEVVNGQVYFAANDGVHGDELWTTDGTEQGTRLVSDIRPGPVGSYPATMTELDGELFLVANDGIHGREPWRLGPSDALPGDANGDGTVDGEDLNVVGLNWQQEVTGFENGDFTGDGRVDAADLNVLARNWRRAQSATGRIRSASNRKIKDDTNPEGDDQLPKSDLVVTDPVRPAKFRRSRVARLRR